MTRRCSVMRMPVAAQRASMPVALSVGEDFRAVMVLRSDNEACSATVRALRQVAAHQQGVQLFRAGLPVIAFATSGDPKSAPLVKPPRRLIVFLDLEEDGAHAASRQMTKMGQQEFAGQAATAMALRHRDRKYLGLVRRDPGDRKADDLAPGGQAVNQRVALGQHGLEFAFAPATVK